MFRCVLDSTHGGDSSAVDAVVANIRSDVIFDRGYDDRTWRVFQSEPDALAVVSPWKYNNYPELCVGWFDHIGFAEMKIDGNNLVAYNRGRQARDNSVGEYSRRRKVLERTYARISPVFSL